MAKPVMPLLYEVELPDGKIVACCELVDDARAVASRHRGTVTIRRDGKMYDRGPEPVVRLLGEMVDRPPLGR